LTCRIRDAIPKQVAHPIGKECARKNVELSLRMAMTFQESVTTDLDNAENSEATSSRQ